MIITAPTSYNRLTSHYFSQLSHWQNLVRRSFPLRGQRTALPRVTLPKKAKTPEEADCDDEATNPRATGT